MEINYRAEHKTLIILIAKSVTYIVNSFMRAVSDDVGEVVCCVGCSRERWTAGRCCALRRIATSPWCLRANAAHAASPTRAWHRAFGMTSPRLVRMNMALCASAAPPGSNTAPSVHSASARSLHHTNCTHTETALIPPPW